MPEKAVIPGNPVPYCVLLKSFSFKFTIFSIDPSNMRKTVKINKTFLILFVILTFVVYSGCTGAFSGDNTGTVTINLGGASSGNRVAYDGPPDAQMLEYMKFEITFSGSGGNISISAEGERTVRATIPVGFYNVKVDAFIIGDNVHYATGSSTVDVKAGQSNLVSVTMGPAPEHDYPFLETYTVTFDGNGGTGAVPPYVVYSGDTISVPVDPTRTGYECIFDGWFKEAGLTNAWNFQTDIVDANITLYAKWRPYEIGDTGPGGGTIFYRAPAGFNVQGYLEGVGATAYLNFNSYTAYYLETSTSWVTGPEWATGTGTNQIIPSLSQSPGDTTDWDVGRGRLNTAIIIAHGLDNGYTTPIASACMAIGADWFLLSKNELNALHDERIIIGITEARSWTSSQVNAGEAWQQLTNTPNKSPEQSVKDSVSTARAIRAF